MLKTTNYYEKLLKDLCDAGYYKSDLEIFIGLSKNSISSMISGSRKISRASMYKLDEWVALENKPNPIEIRSLAMKSKNGILVTAKSADNDLTLTDNSSSNLGVKEESTSTLKITTIYPKDYMGWLHMAKEGVANIDAFKEALRTSELNANQKEMVISKIKQQC